MTSDKFLFPIMKTSLTAAREAFASQMRVDQGSSCRHILKGIARSVDLVRS